MGVEYEQIMTPEELEERMAAFSANKKIGKFAIDSSEFED